MSSFERCSSQDASQQATGGPSGSVLQFGPRSAGQVGYDLMWEAGHGRAEDWRRDAGLPGRQVAMLTVAEGRQAASAAAGQVEDTERVDAYSDDRLLEEWPWAFEQADCDDAVDGLVDE